MVMSEADLEYESQQPIAILFDRPENFDLIP